MDQAYVASADTLGLSCEGCADNCCHTYFQHHTYVEWAYLWQGIKVCPKDEQEAFVQRARDYLDKSRLALASGERPREMCPLNRDGLCALYTHRLMICRLHGVPNRFSMPNGMVKDFPGCFKSQELAKTHGDVPVLDRTPLYRQLAELEMALLGKKRGQLPRVNLTLAEMLVHGPPPV